MGVKKTSSESGIKEWKKPELTELNISATRFGQQGEWDGDGYGEDLPQRS